MVAIPLKQGRIETGLIARGLDGFQRRVEVELQPSGIAELDAVLGGGFPRGDLMSPSYLAPANKTVRKTRSPDSAGKKPVQVHGWPHPRELMRGVDKAIPGLVGKQAAFSESTRVHVVARCAGEQVERDRELPR